MRHTAILAAVAVVCLTSQGRTATINVPADQPTIQEGIDAASPGDTVLIADGTYSGPGNHNISFGGKNIVVRSQNGAATTIVDALLDTTHVFVFSNNEDTLAELSGFTIRGAVADTGAGVLITNSSPIISNCIFTAFAIAHWYQWGWYYDPAPFGIGLACLGNSHPIIRNCDFVNTLPVGSGNNELLKGGGIAVNGPAMATVTDCDFHEIYPWFCDVASGVAIYDSASHSRYIRCRIERNATANYHGSTFGSPIFLFNSACEFDSCLIARNIIDDGFYTSGQAGGVWAVGGNPLLKNCTFYGNAGCFDVPDPYAASAILCQNSQMTIANCCIAFNGPRLYGSEITSSAVSIYPETLATVTITGTNIFGHGSVGNSLSWVGAAALQYHQNGNICANPLFCDTTQSDFRVSQFSPNLYLGPSELIGAFGSNPNCPNDVCCRGQVGNINDDPEDQVDITDLTALIDNLFFTFSPLFCAAEANCDGDPSSSIDLGDLTALIDNLFISFQPLPACAQ